MQRPVCTAALRRALSGRAHHVGADGLRAWLAPRGSRRDRLWQLGRRCAAVARGPVRRALQLAAGIVPAAFFPARPFPFGAALPARAPAEPYDVLCLPIIEWDYRFQRPQQLMRQFAQHGHRVFYASHQFLLRTPLAVAEWEPQVFDVQLRGNVGRDFYHAAATAGDAARMAEALGRLLPGRGPHGTLVVVQLPYWTRLAAELQQRFGWRIVYDCMDDLSGFSPRKNSMVAMEPRMVEIADGIVVSSDLLYRKTRDRTANVAIVRNGVDYDHFAQVAADSGNTAPNKQIVIGYYGAIARWFDSQLVADLAAAHPEWHFQLIGDTYATDLARLRKLSNIELLGERPYAELPQHIRHWHCCIIPFKRIPLTEATNPVKVYEMLAAGKPVVAVDLPELRSIAEAGLIRLANDAEGFAAAIARNLVEDSADARAARQAFARQNTWTERFREFAAAVAEHMA